jgi:4-diphosphocytidyl-2-C-methyl-D-erythritol kinase
MTLEIKSPCKVNLILNILGRRPDGFHELETLMQPVRGVYDELRFSRGGTDIRLTCNHPELPTDSRNLVHRAATAFLEAAGIREGLGIHLEKRIPLAAGMGGGSGNAATALLGLNELFGLPLSSARLHELAARLGSDVPFFLQDGPALALGRGERVESLPPFRALQGAAILLIHPGFGISTPWAYQQLGRFPSALNGKPGRARALVKLLDGIDLRAAGREFYNSLEAPALEKHPILELYQQHLREQDAAATLMSGSGSTTFALAVSLDKARHLEESFKSRFGTTAWTAVVPL